MATDPQNLTDILRKPMHAASPSEPAKPAESSPCELTPSREAVYLRRGFPLRHLRKTVSDVFAPQKAVYEKIEKGQKASTGSLYVLWGPRGTGKTQIAVDAALAFPLPTMEPKQPRYTKASDIFREVRGTFRKDSAATEAGVVAGYVVPRLLIIDEAQERGETEFEDRILTHIIDKRYDAMLHTILISNLTREEIGKSLGPSIVSRIHETGEAIECTWPSFREKKG